MNPFEDVLVRDELWLELDDQHADLKEAHDTLRKLHSFAEDHTDLSAEIWSIEKKMRHVDALQIRREAQLREQWVAA